MYIKLYINYKWYYIIYKKFKLYNFSSVYILSLFKCFP